MLDRYRDLLLNGSVGALLRLPLLIVCMAACISCSRLQNRLVRKPDPPPLPIPGALVMLTRYYQPEAQLESLKVKARNGDADAAMDVVLHYVWAEHKYEIAAEWSEVAAKLGDPMGVYNMLIYSETTDQSVLKHRAQIAQAAWKKHSGSWQQQDRSRVRDEMIEKGVTVPRTMHKTNQ